MYMCIHMYMYKYMYTSCELSEFKSEEGCFAHAFYMKAKNTELQYYHHRGTTSYSN